MARIRKVNCPYCNGTGKIKWYYEAPLGYTIEVCEECDGDGYLIIEKDEY